MTREDEREDGTPGSGGGGHRFKDQARSHDAVAAGAVPARNREAGAGNDVPAPTSAPGPSFKDQVRSQKAGAVAPRATAVGTTGTATQPPASAGDDRSLRGEDQQAPTSSTSNDAQQSSAAGSSDTGPHYKDQVRDSSSSRQRSLKAAAARSQRESQKNSIRGGLDVLEEDKKPAAAAPPGVGALAVTPSGVRQLPQDQDQDETFSTIQQAQPQPLTPSSPLITAHVVEDQDNDVQATAEPLPAVNRRQVVMSVVATLLLTAAIAGGVCGSGNCKSSSSDGVLQATMAPSIAPSIAPSTAPSLSPSVEPTVNPDVAALFVDFVNSITYSSGNTISFPPNATSATAEERALEWLIDDDPLDLWPETNQTRLAQRYALATLWFSTNGPSWETKDGWMVEEDECTWFGVVCQTVGTVTDFQLAANNLDGTIPEDFALFQSLRTLVASINPMLSGPYPLSFTELRSLIAIVLSQTGFSGPLPQDIGNLSLLQEGTYV